jgi:hypothetical protein
MTLHKSCLGQASHAEHPVLGPRRRLCLRPEIEVNAGAPLMEHSRPATLPARPQAGNDIELRSQAPKEVFEDGTVPRPDRILMLVLPREVGTGRELVRCDEHHSRGAHVSDKALVAESAWS